MSKKKKVNPHRKPTSNNQKFNDVKHQSIDIALAIFFQAALDSGLVTTEQLRDVLWPKVEYLSESISEGRVNVWDMAQCLRDEYGILF